MMTNTSKFLQKVLLISFGLLPSSIIAASGTERGNTPIDNNAMRSTLTFQDNIHKPSIVLVSRSEARVNRHTGDRGNRGANSARRAGAPGVGSPGVGTRGAGRAGVGAPGVGAPGVGAAGTPASNGYHPGANDVNVEGNNYYYNGKNVHPAAAAAIYGSNCKTVNVCNAGRCQLQQVCN